MAIEVQQPQPSVSPVKMSFWDYLTAYNRVEGVEAEWNAGVVGLYPMGSNATHQDLLLFFAILFNLFLKRHGLGKVILAGFPMYLGDDKAAHQPDLLIILASHLDRIQHSYLDGPADIAVEIVSPESFERDYATKFVDYESAGIPEYWRIDPIRRVVVIYVLGGDHYYHRASQDDQGRLASIVLPGFALDPAILWQENLPDVTTIPALVEQMG